MNTTQGKAVGAFAALTTMARRITSNFTAYKLFKLKKALQDVVDFQSEQEQKLVTELGGTVTETGMIVLEDKNKAEYSRKHKELEAMECEIDWKPVVMYIKELPDISVAEIEALDEFIDWKE